MIKDRYYPKISIVTPSYNQGDFIEETILSVIQQNYPNLEYIIIDGGSTDNTVNIIKKYADKLFYWTSEKDNGQYDAINKGFAYAQGEIFAYINSDDVLSKNSLFTIAQLFTEYSFIAWLGGIPNAIDEQGRIVEVGTMPKWNKYRYYSNDYKYIQQEGVFFRRALWLNVGGYISTEYKLASDLDLWSRFFDHAEFYNIPGLLGSFRKRSINQKSSEGINLYNEEAELIISKLNISKEDRLIIKQSRNIIYRFLKRLPARNYLWKYLDIYGLKKNYYKFPKAINFDWLLQKYTVQNN